MYSICSLGTGGIHKLYVMLCSHLVCFRVVPYIILLQILLETSRNTFLEAESDTQESNIKFGPTE